MKTKLKSHGNEATDFYNKRIPKADSNYTCLAVITLYSALKKDRNYYLQLFLKECKYIEKKVIRHINDNLSGFSSFSDESDEEKINRLGHFFKKASLKKKGLGIFSLLYKTTFLDA